MEKLKISFFSTNEKKSKVIRQSRSILKER